MINIASIYLKLEIGCLGSGGLAEKPGKNIETTPLFFNLSPEGQKSNIEISENKNASEARESG